TFRDPAVVKLLNEQFIPVKIDAAREAGLTQALQIHSYPTLIFAAPDGRILGRHEGFMEADRFNQQLSRALKESTPASVQEAPMQQPAPTFRGVAGDPAPAAVRTT